MFSTLWPRSDSSALSQVNLANEKNNLFVLKILEVSSFKQISILLKLLKKLFKYAKEILASMMLQVCRQPNEWRSYLVLAKYQ